MSYLQDRYINPLTDFGFKKIFGTEEMKDVLMTFLNLLLPENHQISDLEFANNEHLGNAQVDRKAIFDLYCQSSSGERFIVEMQKAEQNWFKDRSIYYATFPIQEQAKKGKWNYKLSPVYSIAILDFVFDDHKEESDLLHQVMLKNQHGQVFYRKLKFIFIELPKFQKTDNELQTLFDKFLYVLIHLSELQDRPIALQERIFRKIFETAEIAMFTPEERGNYESSLKYYRDMKNVLDTSFDKGKFEGKAEGKLERTLELAQVMKTNGLSLDQISQITGLSLDQIDGL